MLILSILLTFIVASFYYFDEIFLIQQLMKNSRSRSNHIMHFFELQTDYLNHKRKIVNIQKRNAVKDVKKNYYSQMDMINSFHRNFEAAQSYKLNQRQKTIKHENQLLHNNLMRQYKRKSNHHETFNATLKSNRSNRCSTESMKFSESRKKLKSLSKENEKMLQKISGVESSLCKDKMVSDYKKTKQTKRRLRVMSSQNKFKIESGLRKMKIAPVVSFPKVRSKNTIQKL